MYNSRHDGPHQYNIRATHLHYVRAAPYSPLGLRERGWGRGGSEGAAARCQTWCPPGGPPLPAHRRTPLRRRIAALDLWRRADPTAAAAPGGRAAAPWPPPPAGGGPAPRRQPGGR
eukprot:1192801-Prorocentrum_minimum.AAC.3